MDDSRNPPDPGLGLYARRVALTLLMGASALALWRLAVLVIILFGAVLMAIALRAATRLIKRGTKIGDAPALIIAIGATMVNAVTAQPSQVTGYQPSPDRFFLNQ